MKALKEARKGLGFKRKGHPQFIIEGRRWFDKVNGNTYHSVRVYKMGRDGKEFIGEEPFAYGYDEMYVQTAHELLQKAGYMPKTDARARSGADMDWSKFQMDRRENRDKYVISVADVTRKKDL